MALKDTFLVKEDQVPFGKTQTYGGAQPMPQGQAEEDGYTVSMPSEEWNVVLDALGTARETADEDFNQRISVAIKRIRTAGTVHARKRR